MSSTFNTTSTSDSKNIDSILILQQHKQNFMLKILERKQIVLNWLKNDYEKKWRSRITELKFIELR